MSENIEEKNLLLNEDDDYEDDLDEIDNIEELETPRKLRFDLLFPVIIRPKKTFSEIVRFTKAIWLVPILLLTILVVLQAVVASPIKAQEIRAGFTLPKDFESYPEEMKQNIFNSQDRSASSTATLIFPALGAVGGIWFGWLIFSSLLHLTLTLNGGKGKMGTTLNLVGWAMLPLAIRTIIQIISILVTRQGIYGPGLSGLVVAQGGFISIVLSQLLGAIDIFSIWTFVLIVLGIKAQTHFPWSKSILVSLIPALVLILLNSIPAALLGRFSPANNSTSSGFGG